MWCALFGENLQDGVAGFGETPAKAMWAFDVAWNSQNGHSVCGEVMGSSIST